MWIRTVAETSSQTICVFIYDASTVIEKCKRKKKKVGPFMSCASLNGVRFSLHKVQKWSVLWPQLCCSLLFQREIQIFIPAALQSVQTVRVSFFFSGQLWYVCKRYSSMKHVKTQLKLFLQAYNRIYINGTFYQREKNNKNHPVKPVLVDELRIDNFASLTFHWNVAAKVTQSRSSKTCRGVTEPEGGQLMHKPDWRGDRAVEVGLQWPQRGGTQS